VDPVTYGGKDNKRTDQLAGGAVENGIEWHALIRPSDFLPLSRVNLLAGIVVIWEDMLTLSGL
jgi:hypothetical protein